MIFCAELMRGRDSEMEGICRRNSWMTFLGGLDLRKGFGNRRDSRKGLVDDIPGQKGLAEGIQKWKGFAKGICR